jgi:hypothetical protein
MWLRRTVIKEYTERCGKTTSIGRRSDKAMASPSSSKSGKEDTTKPFGDENLWINDTLENVDHVREKQDCCQGELDSYDKKWDRFRAELDRFQEAAAHPIKDTVIREVYNRFGDEWDLFQVGVKRSSAVVNASAP